MSEEMADVRAIAIKRLALEFKDLHRDWLDASVRAQSCTQAILLCEEFLEKYKHRLGEKEHKDIKRLIERLMSEKEDAERAASMCYEVLQRIEREISTVLGEKWVHITER